MRNGKGLLGAVALVALMTGRPAAAQDDPPSATAAATAVLLERIALEKAQADLAGARIKTLGLSSDATGATELKDTGGEFEGWLLSANAIEAAGTEIAGRLTGGGNLLLVAGNERVDLALGQTMRGRLDYLARLSRDAQWRATCAAPPAVGLAPAALPLAPLAPYLGALIGAFKTDTTVSGFAGPTDARMVVAALARHRPAAGAGLWIVPGEQVGVAEDAPLLAKWSTVLKERDAVEACRARLATKTSTDQLKAHIADLDVALKTIDDFASKQVGDGDGESPLIQAARIDALAVLKPQVVRIHVEKAGGSILLRKNLWTALGAPAIGITGGAVVGWRRTDPQTGALLAGGNLACRTQLTNMRAIQRGVIRRPSCGWTATDGSALP